MLRSGRRPDGTWEDKRVDALQVDCSIRRLGNFAFQQGRSSTNPGRRESGREWSSHPFKSVDCTFDFQTELGPSSTFQLFTSLLNLGICSTLPPFFQVPCVGKLQMLELPTRFIGSEILEPSEEIYVNWRKTPSCLPNLDAKFVWGGAYYLLKLTVPPADVHHSMRTSH